MSNNIRSDTSLDLVFEKMTDEEIKEFYADLEKMKSLSELIEKGYSFSGSSCSKSIFIYKNNPPIRLMIS